MDSLTAECKPWQRVCKRNIIRTLLVYCPSKFSHDSFYKNCCQPLWSANTFQTILPPYFKTLGQRFSNQEKKHIQLAITFCTELLFLRCDTNIYIKALFFSLVNSKIPTSTHLNPLQPTSTILTKFNLSRKKTSIHFNLLQLTLTYFNLFQPTSPIYQPLFTNEKNRPQVSIQNWDI